MLYLSRARVTARQVASLRCCCKCDMWNVTAHPTSLSPESQPRQGLVAGKENSCGPLEVWGWEVEMEVDLPESHSPVTRVVAKWRSHLGFCDALGA